MSQEITNSVKSFIVDTFLFGQDDGLTIEESLLDKGIIDSAGVLELVTHLEDTHNIEVDDDEIIPDNLDSITKIAAYITKKQG